LKNYTAPFENKGQRNGPLAFAKSLLNDQDWFESLWSRRGRINEKPILFIWGMKDAFITPKYLDRFRQGFPEAYVEKLITCGHFPQEEQSETVLKSMREFLKLV
jgi:haloalkane dehalogenase